MYIIAKSCVTIHAPGKLNLHLEIGERRPDGFHDLRSIFICLDFGDTLRFELGGDRLVIDVEGAGIPLEDTMVRRAVERFSAQTGFDLPLHVQLQKRIPIGGGLGGGSSDAAATLLALDALAETGLSQEALFRMAADLGSDVPFFLQQRAAWVEGRGDVLLPIPMPGAWWIVLVNPGFSCDTGEAYGMLDAMRESGAGRNAEKLPREALIAALSNAPSTWPFRNDFLQMHLERGAPELREAFTRILADLAAQGAEFRGLSGTGATCFGIFTDKGAAERAVISLKDRWFFTHLTFFLAFSVNWVVQ